MRRLSIAVVALFAGLPVIQADTLESVLARMDSASAAFRSMTSKLLRTQHTAILNDSTKEAGTIKMLRVKANDLRVLTELVEPDPKAFALHDRKAEIYYPKSARVEEYDLGKHKGLLEQFLLLGFGSSSKELAKAYAIKLLPGENVAGQPAAHLELIPKSNQVKEHIVKVDLWINGNGYPVRQKFTEPSGNYQMADYTDLKINPGLTIEDVTLKVPKNVKREYPLK
jgi:outer membrane lipoprotein-sorting protein